MTVGKVLRYLKRANKGKRSGSVPPECQAAGRFPRGLIVPFYTPRVVVTDKLRSYIKPIEGLAQDAEHRTRKKTNMRSKSRTSPPDCARRHSDGSNQPGKRRGLSDDEATAPQLAVKAGPLEVRVNLSGLDTLSENGIEGVDRYLVQLWSGLQPEGVRALKAWR